MGRRDQGAQRIVTCCYCGARSLIGPRVQRHDLVCHGCGAPILRIDLPVRPRLKCDRCGLLFLD